MQKPFQFNYICFRTNFGKLFQCYATSSTSLILLPKMVNKCGQITRIDAPQPHVIRAIFQSIREVKKRKHMLHTHNNEACSAVQLRGGEIPSDHSIIFITRLHTGHRYCNLMYVVCVLCVCVPVQ